MDFKIDDSNNKRIKNETLQLNTEIDRDINCLVNIRVVEKAFKKEHAIEDEKKSG